MSLEEICLGIANAQERRILPEVDFTTLARTGGLLSHSGKQWRLTKHGETNPGPMETMANYPGHPVVIHLILVPSL